MLGFQRMKATPSIALTAPRSSTTCAGVHRLRGAPGPFLLPRPIPHHRNLDDFAAQPSLDLRYVPELACEHATAGGDTKGTTVRWKTHDPVVAAASALPQLSH